ncbi:MAG: PAS domain S-box protein [bacterium]|nr:PAS domain S-box protein [bacterium]
MASQNYFWPVSGSPGKQWFPRIVIFIFLATITAPGRLMSQGFADTISEQRPFYQTPWFYILSAIVLLLLVLLISNFMSKKRHALRLEAEVRQRTKQLAESEEELRNIFDNAHDAIFIFDPESEIIFEVNQGACKMYGFSREEFIGKSLKPLVHDVSAGEKMIAETLEHGTSQAFESVHYRKDGSRLLLEINASVLNYKDRTAVLIINRDITQRKQAERQLKKSLRDKEALLKEIHHRVKNNLQIISSLLDLQSDSLEDSRVLNVFRNSRDRIYSMALVHENLYRSGNLAYIDISQYIRDIVDHFLTVYGDREAPVTPRLDVSSISLGMDRAIPLGLILTELVSNSLKHAFSAGGEGEIFLSLHPSGSHSLTLTFKDNGIGLPPGMDVEETRSLGFQLVSILTEQLNGQMEVQRSGGTLFNITFPYNFEKKEIKKE